MVRELLGTLVLMEEGHFIKQSVSTSFGLTFYIQLMDLWLFRLSLSKLYGQASL